MAVRTVTTRIDDLDGSESSEEVEILSHAFSLDDDVWVIDLTGDNFAKLQEALAPFIAVGTHESKLSYRDRPSRSARRSRGKKGPARGGPDPDLVREWARENGFEVSERGRLKASVVEAYEAAN